MSEENPWKTVSSSIAYRNDWITVREDQVICPDGSPGIYGVVETRIATGVVALTQTNEIYLVGQYRYAIGQYSWEIIEGGSDPGEKPLTTAKRELEEEAGLVAQSWQQLGAEVYLSNCHSSEEAYFYLAQDLEQVDTNPDCTEVLQIKKIPLAQAVQMVRQGEIKDSMSIIGILRAEEHCASRIA